jgi:hypothetical protein
MNTDWEGHKRHRIHNTTENLELMNSRIGYPFLIS